MYTICNVYKQDFVREILREQPDNIYNFGAKYFSELANPVSTVLVVV